MQHTEATLAGLGVTLADVSVTVDGQPMADVVSFDTAAGWAKVLVEHDEETGLYRYRKTHGVVTATVDGEDVPETSEP